MAEAAQAGFGWDEPLLYERGATDIDLGVEDLRAAVKEALDKLGKKEKVLIVPPVRRRTRLVNANRELRTNWRPLGSAPQTSEDCPAFGGRLLLLSLVVGLHPGTFPSRHHHEASV